MRLLVKLIAVLFMIGIAIGITGGFNKLDENASVPIDISAKQEEENCRADLMCWARKNRASAEVDCGSEIEKLARYDVQWTDDFGDPRFSQYAWSNQRKGIIDYFGDRVKFQNGFGAWQIHQYTCTYDTINKKVLDTIAEPGRL